MITAPFNFVPLSEKVFFPDWAEDVSHDVPFEDGESGEIEITITAKSPLFIRDHENKEEFCSHNKEYFIPGSSVKGMVRNVLEIMSFSKMSQLNDDTYAVRDLSKSDNFYMNQMNQHKNTTYCGWLKKEGKEYVIEDCNIPGRIHHNQIDYALNIEFSKYFKSNKFNARDNNQKTSEYKYKFVGEKIHTIKVGEMYKSATNAKYDLREFYKFDKEGQNEAKLVLTGQPTARANTGKMGDGKGFEFLFFESKKELKISEETYNNFLFAYFNERKTEPNESPDWKYWKEKLEKGEKVPVFFQKSPTGVAHFGLSYLYKLPYKHSVKDGLPSSHIDVRKDLSEIMFGYIANKEALKGRIQFSHFKSVKNITILNKRTEILGTPRASYYPMYVRQNNTDFITFMDDHFSIAGWKRYPLHRGANVRPTTKTDNTNVGTTFAPLKEGSTFKGKLRYHNLTKVELGALLSSLTFHNTKSCFHNIGMAKSLGYGKIEVKIDNMDIHEYIKAFELEMSISINNWAGSEQMLQLISMASEQNNKGNSALEYMSLPAFGKSKSQDRDYLCLYTELDNIETMVMESLLSREEKEGLKVLQEQKFEEEKCREEEEKVKQAEIKAEEDEQKEFKKEVDYLDKTDNIQVILNFIEKYPDYENIADIIGKKDDLEKAVNEKKADKHAEVDVKAKAAWELVEKKKSNKKHFDKEKDKFLKKWKKEQNNKGSEYILLLLEKVEKMK